jgi:hypothetical protein
MDSMNQHTPRGSVSSPFSLQAAAAVGFLLLLLPACQTAQSNHDLATNTRLCPESTFTTVAPGDRKMFLAPVADERASNVLPAAEGGYPFSYDSDDSWSRPVQVMVGEVLQRELEHSGLFAAVETTASPEDLVLQPRLVTFCSGLMEVEFGGRSFGEVALRLQVYGPADAKGNRTLLLEKVCLDRAVSGAARVPPSPRIMVGRSLHDVVKQVLGILDGSNVSRSNVPLVLSGDSVAAPAAASPGAAGNAR